MSLCLDWAGLGLSSLNPQLQHPHYSMFLLPTRFWSMVASSSSVFLSSFLSLYLQPPSQTSSPTFFPPLPNHRLQPFIDRLSGGDGVITVPEDLLLTPPASKHPCLSFPTSGMEASPKGHGWALVYPELSISLGGPPLLHLPSPPAPPRSFVTHPLPASLWSALLLLGLRKRARWLS